MAPFETAVPGARMRVLCSKAGRAGEGNCALHLPNHARIEANFALFAGLSRGLSGGDILNIALNAIHAGSADADPDKWRITQGMLEREIEKARAAREEHGGRKRRENRVIGFGM